MWGNGIEKKGKLDSLIRELQAIFSLRTLRIYYIWDRFFKTGSSRKKSIYKKEFRRKLAGEFILFLFFKYETTESYKAEEIGDN